MGYMEGSGMSVQLATTDVQVIRFFGRKGTTYGRNDIVLRGDTIRDELRGAMNHRRVNESIKRLLRQGLIEIARSGRTWEHTSYQLSPLGIEQHRELRVNGH